MVKRVPRLLPSDLLAGNCAQVLVHREVDIVRDKFHAAVSQAELGAAIVVAAENQIICQKLLCGAVNVHKLPRAIDQSINSVTYILRRAVADHFWGVALPETASHPIGQLVRPFPDCERV